MIMCAEDLGGGSPTFASMYLEVPAPDPQTIVQVMAINPDTTNNPSNKYFKILSKDKVGNTGNSMLVTGRIFVFHASDNSQITVLSGEFKTFNRDTTVRDPFRYTSVYMSRTESGQFGVASDLILFLKRQSYD